MHACVQHRQLLGVQSKVALLFEFTLTYEQALAYRKLTGHTVRKSYWKDLTIQVYIDLDIECRWELSSFLCKF